MSDFKPLTKLHGLVQDVEPSEEHNLLVFDQERKMLYINNPLLFVEHMEALEAQLYLYLTAKNNQDRALAKLMRKPLTKQLEVHARLLQNVSII